MEKVLNQLVVEKEEIKYKNTKDIHTLKKLMNVCVCVCCHRESKEEGEGREGRRREAKRDKSRQYKDNRKQDSRTALNFFLVPGFHLP